MSKAFLKTSFSIILLAPLLFLPVHIFSQAKCVDQDEVKRSIALLESDDSRPRNEKLSKELVKMKEKYREKYNYAADEDFKSRSRNQDLTKILEKNDARLCAIVKEFGWPTIRLVGDDGAEAALFLLRSTVSLQFQSELLPLLSEAVKKGHIEKNDDFAVFIDRLRVRAGNKQLFGTQTTRRGDFLVLEPLQSERQVDDWRREYGMSTLADFIKRTELRYRTPVLRSRGTDPVSAAVSDGKTPAAASPVPPAESETDEVLRVDTKLVSLPVFVYDPSNNPMNVLSQKDFEVYEDGLKQEIAFFSAADISFDLVLLIDLSGSTEKMLDLIKSTTTRFIEMKRPADRLAIVTFAEKTIVVSPLTADRERLLASVQAIADKGNSRVWDALNLTLENVFDEKVSQKRRAVVFLTDGVDNSLEGDNRGSKISFNALFENVKASETTIFPIYLDTESQYPDSADAYKTARNTLALLANETGGRSYKAKRIEDLTGVYRDVIGDLSRIYTIGYLPTNDKRDGTWRKVEVKVPGSTELSVKTKAGYYAK